MKIFMLWDYYDAYLRNFYLRYPEALQLPYPQQHQVLMNDFFVWVSYLVPYFEALGHETQFTIGNAKYLQEAWAREKAFSYDSRNWQFSIVREEIRGFQPDVLWLSAADHYMGAFLTDVKDYCKSVIAWRASTFSPRLDWSSVDCVFSSLPQFVDYFRLNGKRSELIMPCFEQRILNHMPSRLLRNCDSDVSFSGSLSNVVQYMPRFKIIKFLRKHLPIHVYCEKPQWRRRPWPLRAFMAQYLLILCALQNWRSDALYGLEMFKMLRRSKIVLNIYGLAGGGLAENNIRMFEVAGVGSFLLTEMAPNIAKILEPEREVATYSGPEDALERIKYYLSHDDEREAIARAGQERVLAQHNSEIRADEIADLLTSVVKA